VRAIPFRSLLVKVREAVIATWDGKKKIAPVDSSLMLTEALLEWSNVRKGQLLIILDQFESIFSITRMKTNPGPSPWSFPAQSTLPTCP